MIKICVLCVRVKIVFIWTFLCLDLVLNMTWQSWHAAVKPTSWSLHWPKHMTVLAHCHKPTSQSLHRPKHITVLAHCHKPISLSLHRPKRHDSPGTLPKILCHKACWWNYSHIFYAFRTTCIFITLLLQPKADLSHITILCLHALCHWSQLLSCETAALPQEAKGDLRMIAGTCATMPDTSRWRQFPRYSIAACSWLGVRAPRGVLWRLSRSKYITSLPYTNLNVSARQHVAPNTELKCKHLSKCSRFIAIIITVISSSIVFAKSYH